MVLTAEKQENIRKAIEEQTLEDFRITGIYMKSDVYLPIHTYRPKSE